MTKSTITLIKMISCTVFALIAFAANSVLCRMALGADTIDASSFTVVRLLSGTLTLIVILKLTAGRDGTFTKGSWVSGLMLFLYAITFSFAYISMDIGTGALVLFGAVQITMILSNIVSGNKLHISEWVGVFLAFTGLVYLVLPWVTTPSFRGFVLMTAAGIAWGIYTLRGRISMHPLADTAYNFLRTTPLFIVLALIAMPTMKLSFQGIFLAVLSGAVASGIGYTVWYFALSGISAIEAAVVQLSVPVIAAIGGIILLSEAITLRLIFAAVMILGGILTVILGRYYFVRLRAETKT